MAAPFPPAGNQTQHTERPLKVYAEQYLESAPLPIGAVPGPILGPGDVPIFGDDLPRVPLASGWVILHLTDWVISNRYSGQPIEVISHEEMTERFGTTVE